MHLYHYTDHEFEIGEEILVMENGYVFWQENRILEEVLEMYRPSDKLSRQESVFLCSDATKENGDHVGSESSSFIATIQVNKSVLRNRSDINWMQPIIQGCYENWSDLYEDFTEEELMELSSGYWSGKAKPGMSPRFEFRTPPAPVKHIEKTKDFIEKIQEDDTVLQL